MEPRIKALMIVAILLTGCAKLRHTPRWPARVQVDESFEEAERTAVESAISGFDSQTESPTRLLGSSDPDAWPITITKKDPPTDKPLRAGLATVSHSNCTIEISPLVFSHYLGFLKSVVWHEIGHCGGLNHAEREGEIMSPTSEKFERYNDESVKRFFNSLLEKISAGGSLPKNYIRADRETLQPTNVR